MSDDVQDRWVMTETSRDAMVGALRAARGRVRGPLRVTMLFECHEGPCPITTLRVAAVERPGGKLLQPKMVCPRCREELVYVQCDPR